MSKPSRWSGTRREFIRVAGVSSALVVAGGCDSDADPVGADTGGTPDVDAGSDIADTGAADVTEVADVSADAATDVADAPADIAPDAVSNLRWPACDVTAATQTVTFVHVNDLHGAFNPDNGGSPLGRIRSYYLQTKAENPYTVFTNAGDDYEKGTVAELMSEGRITNDLIRAMQFDVRCIGNHDFCWSLDSLLEFTRDPHARTLLSNVSYSGPQPERFGAENFVALEVGCVRIGFFGMVSKAWNERNQQIDGPFFPELPMRVDYVARARELVEEHRDTVDILVMVSHLGLGSDLDVAAQVSGINFVLGGHSHSVLAREEVVGDCVVIQAGSSGAFVARLDVDVDLQTRQVTGYRYRLDPNLPLAVTSDEAMDAEVARLFAEHAPDALLANAFSTSSYGGERLAELTARCVRGLGEVNAVICDPWTVWSPLPRGHVGPQQYLDCYKVERQPAGTPGFNAFYVVEMTGADLMRTRAEADGAWQYAMPEMIDSEAVLRVAVQKHIAYNPDVYLPAGVAINEPALLGEAWELLDRWGRARAADCLAIDDDVSYSCADT